MARHRHSDDRALAGVITALLRAEADRYEPDHDRIMGRIREPVATPARAESQRKGQRFRRSGWLVPAVAAGSVVVITGTLATLNRHVDAPKPARTAQGLAAQPTPAPSRSTAVATAISTTAPVSSNTPTPSRTLGLPARVTPIRANPTSAKAPTAARPVTGAGVTMDVATAAPGRAVSLPGGVDDWIVAGANGTDTVRYLRGGQQISGPHLTGNPTARSVHGPFAVSWTGDLNNQSGSESNWLSVTGPAGGPETGLLLRVPATARSAILVLYVGASGADGELQARLGDHGTVVRSPLRVSSQGSGNVRSGTVVTIRFQASGVGDSLQVELSCGSGGSINLAAATLS